MPFVWNNTDHALVDDEEFEKDGNNYHGYVVVRRLYIASSTPFSNTVSILTPF